MNLNKIDYKQIAADFCTYYYSIYDTNINELESLYKFDSIFTYLGQEIKGFSKLCYCIKNKHKIYKFDHIINNTCSQPLGKKTILITVMGIVKTNDCIDGDAFHETIIIQKDNDDNYFIHNSVFTILD